MTAADKKKAQLLVGLIVIAGLTWFLVYRTGGTTSSADSEKKQGLTKPGAVKPIKETTINTQLIESSDAEAEVGGKNIFQYRQRPLPPAPPVQTIRPNPVPVASTPVNTQPYTPPAPLPPPFKAFKYDGLSIMGSSRTGKMMASLTEGTNSYQVTLGECLMGQYCVRQITEKEIEIEDVLTKQRRTFPKTPSQLSAPDEMPDTRLLDLSV
jgi:hypothetical protein